MSSMDAFCGSRFWDYNQTWNTTDPDLSNCFQDTVLTWVPCGFLWVTAPIETYLLLKSSSRLIPWTALNLAKLAITFVLFVISLVEFSYAGHAALSEGIALPSVYFYTPFIKLATFLLAGLLLLAGRKRGSQTSAVLFFFWFLLMLCGLVAYRSHLKRALAPPDEDAPDYAKEERLGEPLFFGAYMAYYPLVIIQFLLNCFADSTPIYRQHVLPPEEKECPEAGSSFLSQMLFSWFDALAYKGWRRPLETSDLWALNFNDRTDQVVPGFDRHWLKQVAAAQFHRDRAAAAGAAAGGDVSATFHHNHANHDGGEVKFSDRSSHKKTGMGSTASLPAGGERRARLSIVKALIQTFGPSFAIGSILKLVHDTLQFVSPQLLRAMIGFVGSDEPAWKGVFYAVLMFATASTQSMVLSRYFHRMYIVGMRIRTCLISAIYRKSLVLSNAAKKESTTGEIVNLMSNDAQRFMELMVFLNMLWSAPYQIALALYFLWQLLGVAVLSGVGIMVLMVPINGFLAAYSKKLQTRQMKHKDERIKLMNEILGGMKVLKLYAWEPSFQDHVQSIREREVRNLRRMAYVSGILSFLWTCAPFLVSLMSFMTYVLIDEKNVLDPQRAFVSLTLFHILRFPLSMLPMLISMLVQASVSVKRMNKYLGHEELEEYVSHEKDDASTPIWIRNGSFAWTKDEEAVLREVDVQVPKGALVAIVGQVGSGKSSLLSALLGDMERLDGTVNVQGSVAYVAQQAWIQNATVRDNILFQKTMERDRYKRTLDQCALQSDLNILPGGDLTEIGEKGINLSGGQKQRVSLARAVYSDADIYLLDDPLSAVDSHVGKHIFDNVIGPKGVLKDKTRLLVTHGISYLPQVDRVIVLRDGRIEEQGTYKELLARKGALAEVLLHFLREESQDDGLLNEDPNLVEDLLLHVGSPEISRQLSQHKSTSELSLAERKEFLRSLSRQLSETQSQSSNGPGLVPQTAGPGVGLRRSSAGTDSMSGRSLTRSQSTLRAGQGDKSSVAEEAGTKLVQAEAAETGRVKWRVYFAYFGAIGVVWMVPIVVMNLASQAFSLGSNVWLTAWSNDPPMPDGSQDLAKRDLRLGVYGALGLAQGVTILLGTLALSLGSLKGAMLLHNGLLHNILRSPMSFFDTTPLGRIVNRFSKDVDTMDLAIPMTVRSWLMCFLQVVSTLIIITMTTPIFLAVAVPVFVLYYIIQAFYVATSRQLKRLESVTRSPIYTHFSETLSGVSTIRAYGAQERFVHESNQRVDHNQMCYYPSTISNRWLAVRLEFCGNLIVLSAALFAVFGSDHLDGGTVGLSLSYALSITATMNWMVRMSCEFETNIVAVERIMEYTRSPTEAAWDVPESKPPVEWPKDGEVQFREYGTRYREGLDLIIKDITVSVHPGEKVGIVGRTGAGKSSLMLSLFRIIEPAQGTILIDGVDVTKIGLHDLRSKLTIIPQDPILFSGTVRTNLDPFKSKSDEEIWAALELSHLKTFISGLDRGLEHEVQEGGENLSVGQRQLLCLARALLRKSKVLVLDEATAAVDMETDELIQQTIRREFAGSTILTIAHRLNTILDYDRILVLEQGRVAEFDTPASLLAAENSIFHGMAKDAGLA
ncbi:multidrug resistance-associated protein 1 [Dermacentor andersoni]|uniref:multidrug resistance-associated protein 1 n=1 Tax=Dermacentor andersoni TaxID=34620 RepID=UPI002155501B|nr:multidrug resistance-associated protein 1-like [Dermacentor andersoni]